MNYTKKQLINALMAEYEDLCHDEPEDDDMTLEEFQEYLEEMTIDELIDETDTDEDYTLDQFLKNYG
jgi:hypothetical protein